jgi:hypothetical protein
MDEQTLALIAAMQSGKLTDYSSATMDPVMSYLMGTYRPKPQFDEAQMWERYAPNTLMAAQGDPKDPYTVAAAKIRAGAAPWSLYDEIPKDVKPGAWGKFVDSIANEQQIVKSKMMEQALEQDPFEKQGLPRADAQYTIEDMYKYAPKEFSKIMEGFDEASVVDSKKKSEIRGMYGDVFAISDADKMKMAMKIQKENAKVNKEKESSDSVLSSIGTGFGKGMRFIPMLITGATPGSYDMTQQEGRAKEALSKDEFKGPIKDLGKSAMNDAYATFLESMYDRKQGTAGRKVSDAQKLAVQLQSQVEAKGGSPLKDALIQAAIMKAALKRGK